MWWYMTMAMVARRTWNRAKRCTGKICFRSLVVWYMPSLPPTPGHFPSNGFVRQCHIAERRSVGWIWLVQPGSNGIRNYGTTALPKCVFSHILLRTHTHTVNVCIFNTVMMTTHTTYTYIIKRREHNTHILLITVTLIYSAAASQLYYLWKAALNLIFAVLIWINWN